MASIGFQTENGSFVLHSKSGRRSCPSLDHDVSEQRVFMLERRGKRGERKSLGAAPMQGPTEISEEVVVTLTAEDAAARDAVLADEAQERRSIFLEFHNETARLEEKEFECRRTEMDDADISLMGKPPVKQTPTGPVVRGIGGQPMGY